MSINRPEQHTSVTPDALPQHIQRVDEAFDNTSLGEAHSEGLLDNQVPDHAQDIIDRAAPDAANFLEHPVRPEVTPNRRRQVLIGASAAVATGLIAAGALFGLKAGGEGSHSTGPSPSPDTTSSAPEMTGKTPEAAQPSKAEQIKALEIKAGQSTEALATDIIHKMSAWGMAGATPENYKNRDRSLTVPEFADKIAAEQGEIYATAMFGPDYASNPQLANHVAGLIKLNSENVRFYIGTFDSKLNPKNIEPYNRQLVPEDLASATPTPDGLKLVVNFHDQVNTGKNVLDSSGVNGLKESMVIVLAKKNDIYVATYFDYNRR